MHRRSALPALLLLAGCSFDSGSLALGRLIVDGNDAVVGGSGAVELGAGTAHTLTFVLIPAGRAIPAGSRIELVVPPTFDPPQGDEGTVPGFTIASRLDADSNLVSSSPVVVFLDNSDARGPRPLAGTESYVAAVWLETALEPGQRVEIVYGETAAGAIGARASSLARDTFAFELRLDTGAGDVASIGSFPVATVPGAARAVRVFPPSTAAVGGEVNVRVAVFDGVGNAVIDPQTAGDGLRCSWTRADRTSTPFPPEGVALRPGGLLAAPDAVGPWWLRCTHPALKVEVEGVSLFRGAAAEAEATSRTLLWGDLHIHSTVSGDAPASLSPADCYAYARESSGLDFASVSDHDRGGIRTQTLFETSEIAPTNDAYTPGAFVSLLSYEWTDQNPADSATEGGHKIVYYLQGDGSHYCEASTDADCASGSTVPRLYSNAVATSDSSCELWGLLASQESSSNPVITGITFPHHVAASGGPSRAAWSTVPADCGATTGPHIQPIAEIFSEHGNNEGWNGVAPGTIEDPIQCSAELGRTLQVAQEYQWGSSGDKSHLLGVIAATDSHTGRPGQDPIPAPDSSGKAAGSGVKCSSSDEYRWREGGLSAVWVDTSDGADAHDRALLYQSLQQRQAYATSGSRISLDYSLEDTVGETTTTVDQGGHRLSGGSDNDDPEYGISSSADRTTSLRLVDICPGTADASLESVRVLRGNGTPGVSSSWAWTEVASFTSFDATTGCLLDGDVPLITAGVRDSAILADGKNVFYVKVKETEQNPIQVTSETNLLRVGVGGTYNDCVLTTGNWLAADYAAQLQADLNSSSCGGAMYRTFTVTYDNVANATPASDFRFRISANGRFQMDNASSTVPEVEATAALIGFAAVDKVSARSYASDDQVQHFSNAEFAWSSPIWVDYTGP